MGVGSAKGTDKAQLAAMTAISSPLLETSIAGATGVLISITASEDIQLDEIDTASHMIHAEAHPDANIIWGATFDSNLVDEMRITIIATGFIKTEDEHETTPVVTQTVSRPAPTYVAPTPVAAPVVEEPAPVSTNDIEEIIKNFPAEEPAPVKRTVVEPQVETKTANVAKDYDASYEDIWSTFVKAKKLK
jgi:cell division protein FtsZ